MDYRKWDLRFLGLAKYIASWSKDPSTKVGAIITRNFNEIVSVGYNGFPIGVDDTQERYDNRELKYKLITHAEINAILRAKQSLDGCSIYLYPFLSCSTCTGSIITSRISRIITLQNDNPRWKESFDLSRMMYQEANIPIMEYNIGDLENV